MGSLRTCLCREDTVLFVSNDHAANVTIREYKEWTNVWNLEDARYQTEGETLKVYSHRLMDITDVITLSGNLHDKLSILVHI